MPFEGLGSRLAEVAREVQAGDDVAAATDRIVDIADSMIGEGTVSAAITLVHSRRRVETAAASTDLARRGDQLQYELHEGPCLDALWEEEQVLVGDLANDRRWSQWSPRVAQELAVSSMLCTRLFTTEDRLGALNIYSRDVDAFDDEDRETARLLAAHAAVAVAAAQEIDSLKLAVDHRTTIGKAIGVLMTRYELTDDQAMSVLRRYSSHGNRKLYGVAQEILADQRSSATRPDE